MSPGGTIGHAEDRGSEGGLLDYNMRDEIMQKWNRKVQRLGPFQQTNCPLYFLKKTGMCVFTMATWDKDFIGP